MPEASAARSLTVFLTVIVTVAVLLCGAGLAQQQPQVQVNVDIHIQGPVNVTVDTTKVVSTMAPRAIGVQAFVHDGNLTNDSTIPVLRNAGVTTLRYPGAGYADNYHWSQHSVTPTKGNPADKKYLAPSTDFGHFMLHVERLGGTAVITVNYGSNLQGTGPGEPKEAAAWVAFANGNPADTREIGRDSAGNDWKTVGYWASLRASKPLPQDDGLNFLRLSHPQSFEIGAWEIGNEVYNNGYYRRDDKGGWEEDLHVPYASEKENAKLRTRNAKLSPATYGAAVAAYYKEMKAVDSRIRIGAAFTTPPDDNDWGSDWNQEVLKASGGNLDFVVLHWYPAVKALPPDWRFADPTEYLLAPERQFRETMAELIKILQKYAPGKNIGFSVAEFGLASWMKIDNAQLHGLFAADTYAKLISYNTMNVDWPELHKEPFLREDGTPGSVYYGMAMVRRLIGWGEPMLSTASNNALLAAYAARHRDGSMGLMFINKDDKFPATVKVKINGDKLGSKGIRWDWGPTNPPEGISPKQTEFAEAGTSFSITVPPYSITTLTLPRE